MHRNLPSLQVAVFMYMRIQEWLYTWGYRSGCIHGDTGVAVYMGIQEWLYTWGHRSGCINGDTGVAV